MSALSRLAKKRNFNKGKLVRCMNLIQTLMRDDIQLMNEKISLFNAFVALENVLSNWDSNWEIIKKEKQWTQRNS